MLDQKNQKIVNGTSLDHGILAQNLVEVEPNGGKEKRRQMLKKEENRA